MGKLNGKCAIVTGGGESLLKTHRRDLIGWAILVGWVLILWAMASKYWHALKFFYWVAVFVLVPLSIILVFKFIWQDEAKQAAGKAATEQSSPEELEDKIV